MTPEEATQAAKAAQASLISANAAQGTALLARDKAILEARRAGVSASDIADELVMSRQQVHRIIDRHTGPEAAIEALRAEVMPGWGNGRYEDMLEDDQIFLDGEVGRLARQRGIDIGL